MSSKEIIRRVDKQEWCRANAITHWTNMSNGIYPDYIKKTYTKEYCEEQIKYFKELVF